MSIPGLKLIKPRLFNDERGYFFESFKLSFTPDLNFVQDNHSYSKQHVIRGMHFQPGQAKLVRCIEGEIFDVAVDMRPNSPTFGKWEGFILDGTNHHQLLIPDGCAHGFAVLSSGAHVCYKVSTEYDPKLESGFSYNDPSVGINWPIKTPILSRRDRVLDHWQRGSTRKSHLSPL